MLLDEITDLIANAKHFTLNRVCVLGLLQDVGFDVTRDASWGDRVFIQASATMTIGIRAENTWFG